MNQPGSLIIEQACRKGAKKNKGQEITSEWFVDELKKITTKRQLHYGIHQQTSGRHIVPNKILAMLHLTRYGMQDIPSMQSFKAGRISTVFQKQYKKKIRIPLNHCGLSSTSLTQLSTS